MLQNLNWPPLTYCRQQLKAIVMFKTMYQLIDIPTDTILQPTPTYHHLRGHTMKLLQPNARIDAYLHSFLPSGIKIWNNLPNSFITLSLEQFKTKPGEHNLITKLFFIDLHYLSVLAHTLVRVLHSKQ